MNIPSVCPVCNGRGFVAAGFYTGCGIYATSTAGTEPCRTCGGTGIVWPPEQAPVVVPVPVLPRYPQYPTWPTDYPVWPFWRITC